MAKPWPHWLLAEVLPREVLRELTAMPLNPAIAEGPSGRREYRNQQRIYFDSANMTRFPPMRHVAEAMHLHAVISAVYVAFCAPIDRTYLRIEYALDIDGFWLEPDTDIVVEKFSSVI